MKRRILDENRSYRVPNLPRRRIAFLSGRPVRETVISEEDCLNLLILLNTENDLIEFLQKV